MPSQGRTDVLHEANLKQMRELRPNLAILPWGATEAHNYHLPYGTDVVEATALGETATHRANEQGARAVLLPTVPFGVDHSQLNQVATITMRASTQLAILNDVALSLTRQGIDRLIVLNFHGGNEFKPLIRDVMLDHRIFIVQASAFQLCPELREMLEHPGDHADEFETSLMLHLKPQWVAPLDEADEGDTTPFALPALNRPGIWASRDWGALTKSTGVGNPKESTAEKGETIFEGLVTALVPVIVELSQANNGDFPFVLS
ncbi:MAG: creatininase family protein [Algisphaera sp.]